MLVMLQRHIFQRDLYYYYTNRVLKLVAVLGLAPTSNAYETLVLLYKLYCHFKLVAEGPNSNRAVKAYETFVLP